MGDVVLVGWVKVVGFGGGERVGLGEVGEVLAELAFAGVVGEKFVLSVHEAFKN